MTKRSSEAQLVNKGIVVLFSEHHLFHEMRDVRHLIARRAYQLFADRGFADGHDLDDWLRAERELLHSAPLELRETDSEFILRAELPGFRENEVTVAADPLSVIIMAEHEAEHEVDSEQRKAKMLYSEWRSNRVFRSLSLPVPVNPRKASMRLSNGLLEIKLTKSVIEKSGRLAA
jgi:HSP20 family molecular chaperone IbpA